MTFIQVAEHNPPIKNKMSTKTLYMKNVVNELIFLPVTHMTCFDIRFNRYEFLKSGFTAGQILDRLVIQVLGQVFGPQDG
jgi:hypothetical protein